MRWQLIFPFVDLKTEYYDLGLPHRDETNDKVTVDAAHAILVRRPWLGLSGCGSKPKKREACHPGKMAIQPNLLHQNTCHPREDLEGSIMCGVWRYTTALHIKWDGMKLGVQTIVH